MKWHCLCYKEVLEKRIVYWDKGRNNDAGYLEKRHPPNHRRQM